MRPIGLSSRKHKPKRSAKRFVKQSIKQSLVPPPINVRNNNLLSKEHQRHKLRVRWHGAPDSSEPVSYRLLQKNNINGGGALPLRYFDPLAEQSSAASGYDLLTGDGIRPRIGGKRSTRKRSSKKRVKGGFTKFATKGGFTKFATKGGFIPSIMEPFALACSKYVMPVAGLSAYKLFHNPTKKYRR